MSWSTADIPHLAGTRAVVTGGNAGLGLATVRALVAAGADVVIAARTAATAEAAATDLRAKHPDANVQVVALDLGSLESVAAAAATIIATGPVDLLVNNAGLMGLPEQRTADGFEMQFGVNHLGHWALTAHLIDTLAAAPKPRIVTVTSTAHHFGRPVDPANPHLDGRYGPWRAYGQSKLANFHFALGLHRKLLAAGSPVASLAAHPGLSNTNLQAHSVAQSGGGASQRFFHWLAGSTGMSEADGALSQLRAAADPAARSGEFYGPLWGNAGPPVRKPVLRRVGLDNAIDRLWQVSERETGLTPIR